MIEAIALLKTALLLLTLVASNPNVSPDFRDRAVAIANQAIMVSTAEIQKTQLPKQTQTTMPDNTNSTALPEPTPESKASIEIFAPMPTKGWERPLRTTPEINEAGELYNEITIAGIVYDDEGNPTNQAAVAISVTKPDTTTKSYGLQGTGNVTPIYENGAKKMYPVYVFTYELTQAGNYSITYSANGLTKTISFNVN